MFKIKQNAVKLANKYTFFINLFVAFFVINMFALKADYSYYFQYNTLFTLKSTITDERKVADKSSKNQYSLDATKGFYNANFILGMNFNAFFATELDIANYDIAWDKDDTKNIVLSNRDSERSLTHVDYVIPTFVYNYANFLGIDFYVKGGLGVGVINLSSSNVEGGNKPEFFYSAATGVLYNFNKHLGLNLGVQYISNIATYKNLSTLSNVDVKLNLQQFTTFVGIRFTL